MKKKLLIFSLCFLYFLIIGGIGCFTLFDTKQNENIAYEDDSQLEVEVVDKIDNDKNKEIIDNYINQYNNDDVKGEISIINTDYKKALMQYSNNDYYLNHLEDGTSSFMGSIYLDFRVDIDNSRKLLVFGHNSSNVDMPFKILEEYYDYDYYKEHQYIKIITKNKTRLYQIYSVHVEVSDFSYMATEFDNEDEWYKHINTLKERSMYDTGVMVDKDDKILILQTCSTHRKYSRYNQKFLLIVAKEISDI